MKDLPRSFRRAASVALLAVLGAAGGWLALERASPVRQQVQTSVSASGLPVILRSPGGLLEVATLTVHERFTRTDDKAFLGVPLGRTVSTIEAPVVYRYHIEMAKEWPIHVTGKTAVVRAPEVKPSLPAAFDTGRTEKYTQSGWARFNGRENLALLERTITPELQARAHAHQSNTVVQEAGRQTVREFVTTWLLKEQGWARDGDHKVVVLFPGESAGSSVVERPGAFAH